MKQDRGQKQEKVYWLPCSFLHSLWNGNFVTDTEIYYGSDLIAVVEDTTNVSFARDFLFV
ncbi:MAG: hypothetical protein F6K36_08935 [Symploca sp. SIO3C6]|nr:hypothetical protein [Symploca sp. SIO3C6]